MKYRRLTIEELEELEKQFHYYLAAHSIPADDWQKLKSNDPDKAENIIDEFSDFIFESILSDVDFLEYRSQHQIQIVDVRNDPMIMKGIKVVGSSKIDFTKDTPALQWKAELMKSGGKVQMMSGKKSIEDQPNVEKFKLMEKGFLILKDPALFQTLSSLHEEE